MKRVYCLYRVSTKKQVDQKDDIPMQKIECRRFAEMQGWTVVKEFSEKGVSGYKVAASNRDAIQELKTAALNKEFDILLVYMFDRLGRRDDETPFVVEWFVKQGIQVWSTQEGEQRFDNQVDKLMNYIRFWQAASESAKTSTRIKTRMQQLTEEGCYTGGTVPYGYKLVKRGRLNKRENELYDLEVDYEEAEIVKLIFEKTVREGYGSFRMASYLNNQGIRTHSGAKFQSNTIIRTLRNKLYCGYLISKETVSPHMKELQIIDKNVFEQAQLIVDQRATKNTEERQIALSTKGKTLLSGNIYCAHCGGRLTSMVYKDRYIRKDGSEYNIEQLKYLCYHKSRKLCQCDGQSTYQAETIDKIVFDVIIDLFRRIKDAPEEQVMQKRFQGQIAGYKVKQKKLNLELIKNNKQLEKLQLEIANSLTGDSVYSAEDLSQAIKTVKSKIETAEIQLTELETEMQQKHTSMEMITPAYNRFVSWANEFENASLEQQKMIACQLISRVQVGRGYQVKIEFDMDYEQFCYEWEIMEQMSS